MTLLCLAPHSKSLLLADVISLLLGGKASSSYLMHPEDTLVNGVRTAMVEMEISLEGPYVSSAVQAFENLGLDTQSLCKDLQSTSCVLQLRRVLLLSPKAGSRVKSVCYVNGQQVTIKTLSELASPLVAVVDASTAASALAQQKARMAVLDTAVTPACLANVRETMENYRRCREERERWELALASMTLPSSFSPDDAEDIELLNHWIGELGALESRVMNLCESSFFDDGDGTEISKAGRALAESSWMESDAQVSLPFSSVLYARLSDFRYAIRSLENRLEAAQSAVAALSALSSPESAITAVERARQQLLETSSPGESEGGLAEATERSHDLLNQVEMALNACSSFLEDDEGGLIMSLERARAACPVTVEDIESLLADWNALARKHGVSPLLLPSCHQGLKAERDGNVEARTLLPEAQQAESAALQLFQDACDDLSQERENIADQLSAAVTRRMPSLGMEKSSFFVNVSRDFRKCSDPSCYTGLATGIDGVDFYLLHSRKSTQGDTERGGKLHEVASSGEKARLLLAMECELPGSVGASITVDSGYGTDTTPWCGLPPIAVLYDEIDAHVGGNAAVSMARMLLDQSRACQVVTITHSPSVAALADMHVVIQKVRDGKETVQSVVKATLVDGEARRNELARMASGDLAVDEAQVFADALLRDGTRRKGERM